MTRPYQGLSSLAPGVKMRDPGNEVASQPGTTGYVSSENFFKPSKTKETYRQILADICRAVGIEVVENNSQFSEHVSNPCARKIRNLRR